MELQRNYYAIIPANVRYDENIRPNSKLLYGEITALCNEKGFCWASNQYFAELYKVSKTSISLWIKELIDNGYVSTEIIYKEGSKEILHRYLRIVNDPTQQKLNTPIKEKLKDNTTSFNNTSNNTKDNMSSKPDIVPYKEIVKYLNEQAGTNYKHQTESTKKFIKARFNEGFTLDDFKKVIDNKVAEWKGHEKWGAYLRPKTLFGTNFEGYLNQQAKPSNQRRGRYEQSDDEIVF